jgi:retinoid hydroxylase
MAAQLPPGSFGLPVLGETLAFVKDPFGAIEARFAASSAPIFKSNVFFRKTAVIAGPEAAQLWLDESLITRDGASPPHVVELFGGLNLSIMDGEPHHARKALIMRAFDHEALAAYLPKLDTMVARYLERLAAVPEFEAVAEMKKLAMEAICATVMGMEPGDELDALSRDYRLILDGFLSVPVPLPGTTFSKARAALRRIMAYFRGVVQKHREAPGDDGLSRLLATGLDPEVLVIELHHIIVAGFIILGQLVSVLLKLHEHGDVRRRLADEVRRASPSGPVSLRALAHELPYLTAVVHEIKRHTPILPMSFGRARQDFELHGFRVPAGWMVLRAVAAGNYVGPFESARSFDPERFLAPRNEHERHPHGFTPQGVGSFVDHKCPGLDFTTLLMQLLCVHLARGYAWEVPADQDLSYRWGLVPPEPRSGARVRLSRAAAA